MSNSIRQGLQWRPTRSRPRPQHFFRDQDRSRIWYRADKLQDQNRGRYRKNDVIICFFEFLENSFGQLYTSSNISMTSFYADFSEISFEVCFFARFVQQR